MRAVVRKIVQNCTKVEFTFITLINVSKSETLWYHLTSKWIMMSFVWINHVVGPVSLRLMTSQFEDIVTHTQKSKTVTCIICGVWVQNFVWNFKGALWNFTQNFEPIHRKLCILRGVKIWPLMISQSYDILSLSETGPWCPITLIKPL